MKFRTMRAILAAGAVVIAGAGAASAITLSPRVASMNPLVADGYGTFDIVLNYTETPDPVYAAAFATAEAFWEQQIVGYRDVSTAIATAAAPLTIDVTLRNIDGPGNVLGGAGTSTYWNGTSYKTAATGQMEFDTSDLASISTLRLEYLILHEMAHVLGLNPSIWSLNGAATNLVSGYFTDYVGPSAVAAYNIENGSSVASILLEDEGGAGTRGAHWNEETFLGTYSDKGNPELMTGWLGADAYVSQTTLFALQDVGFALAASPVPVPAAGGLLAAGVGLLGLMRRRRAAEA